MKPLVIYHADCTDGFGAAFATWLKLGDEAEYLPMQYKQSYDEFWRLEDDTFDSEFQILNREIYILDFSFPRWIMDGLFSTAKRVVWRDHHKTVFEMWCGMYEKGMQHDQIGDIGFSGIDIFLDDNKSGALLAWEHFHPDTEVPLLIRHIDDCDRWQFKLEGSKELHAALWSYQPWNFEQWQLWLTRWPVGWGEASSQVLYTEGAAILRAQEQNIASMLKQARKCKIPYDTRPTPMPVAIGLALNTPMHMSEVGHELANQSSTFGLVWYMGADNRVKCSLRSNGEYDVSAIARAFGGGGHLNAAGFETDIETLIQWLK